MKKNWEDASWEEYIYWQSKDKKVLKKINCILKDIDRNGYNCGGHLEALKGNLSGYYSIHIDKKNRLVFRIINKNGQDEIEILQCGSHYKDK